VQLSEFITFANIHRLLRFAVVAILVGALNISILALLKNHCEAHLAFTIAFLLATTLHYGLNRFWALPSDRHDAGRQFSEYAFTVGLSYIMNFLLFTLAHSLWRKSVVFSAIFAAVPAGIVIFLILNLRVFRAAKPLHRQRSAELHQSNSRSTTLPPSLSE